MARFEKIKKFIAYVYAIYCICYCVAAVVTMLVLYKDQIVAFIKKVGAMLRRMMLKLTCFFKGVEDRRHAKETDTEWLNEAIRNAPTMTMDELEFACSEE